MATAFLCTLQSCYKIATVQSMRHRRPPIAQASALSRSFPGWRRPMLGSTHSGLPGTRQQRGSAVSLPTDPLRQMLEALEPEQTSHAHNHDAAAPSHAAALSQAAVPSHTAAPSHAAARSHAAAPTLIKVEFEVPCRVAYGDNLWVVGDTPDLGAWDPRRGLPLKWGEGDKWTGTAEIMPQREINFKVVILTAAGGVEWERGHNRTIALPALPPRLASWGVLKVNCRFGDEASPLVQLDQARLQAALSAASSRAADLKRRHQELASRREGLRNRMKALEDQVTVSDVRMHSLRQRLREAAEYEQQQPALRQQPMQQEQPGLHPQAVHQPQQQAQPELVLAAAAAVSSEMHFAKSEDALAPVQQLERQQLEGQADTQRSGQPARELGMGEHVLYSSQPGSIARSSDKREGQMHIAATALLNTIQLAGDTVEEAPVLGSSLSTAAAAKEPGMAPAEQAVPLESTTVLPHTEARRFAGHVGVHRLGGESVPEARCEAAPVPALAAAAAAAVAAAAPAAAVGASATGAVGPQPQQAARRVAEHKTRARDIGRKPSLPGVAMIAAVMYATRLIGTALVTLHSSASRRPSPPAPGTA